MMIASRFKTILWVAGVAGAALGCYLISLQVAAERALVARTDHRLIVARADIRHLSTELDTRGRLVQLERWNADVLALSAPKAAQYLSGEMQLASLAAPGGGEPVPDSAAARALQAPPAVAQVAYHRVDVPPATRLLHTVSLDLDSAVATPTVRTALVSGVTARIGYLGGKTLRP